MTFEVRHWLLRRAGILHKSLFRKHIVHNSEPWLGEGRCETQRVHFIKENLRGIISKELWLVVFDILHNKSYVCLSKI